MVTIMVPIIREKAQGEYKKSAPGNPWIKGRPPGARRGLAERDPQQMGSLSEVGI